METPPTAPPPHGYERPQEPQRARKSPVLWILIGCLGLCVCFVPIIAAILFPVFSQARMAATNTQCLSNVKITALGMLLYSGDYDEHFPKASAWMDVTADKYVEARVSHCPSVKNNTGFAFADKMSNALTQKIKDPSTQVLIFETNREVRNAHGDPKEPFKPRHLKQNLAFADGHAKAVKLVN